MHDRRALTRAISHGSAWLIGGRGASFSERVVAVLRTALVGYGLFLRARGYLWHPPAFWLDECTWAMNLVEQPLLELCIRPIGFMFVSRLLAQVFHLTEPVLRAMPWIAGSAAVLMAPALAGRLFRNPAARLLFIAIVALHPCAIDFSKEFKPYSISFALHLALLLLSLRYLATRRRSHLFWLLGTALVGGLFAQDLIFAYPGVFLATGWTALVSRREHVRPIVTVALVIVLLLLAQYFFIWRAFPSSETNTWGEKYNIFFTGRRGQSYGSWWLARQEDMAGFSGFRRKFWKSPYVHSHLLDQLRAVDFTLWDILHVIGLLVIAFRRRATALLLVMPLVTLWVFNVARVWPVGAFRANLFVIGYTAAIACMALDLPARARDRLRDLIPALLLVLAPFVLLDPSKSDHKQALTYASEFPKAIKTIVQVKLATDPTSKETLLLDRRACDPFRFYTEFHPSASSRKMRKLVHAQFESKCVTDDARYRRALLAAMPTAPHHVWTMLHAPRDVQRMIRKRQLGNSELTYDEHIGAHEVMAFWRPAPEVVQPSTEEAPAAPAPASASTPSEEETPEEEPEQAPNSRF